MSRWGNLTPQERFCRFVDHNGPIAKNCPELGPCWLWKGSRTPRGYAVFFAGPNARPKTVTAYRFAYESVIGPIPEGHTLDHFACDNGNGGCVNPHHVRPATQRDNTAGPLVSALTARKAIRTTRRTPTYIPMVSRVIAGHAIENESANGLDSEAGGDSDEAQS